MRSSWEFWPFRVLSLTYGLMAFMKYLADDMDGYYQRLIVSLLFELLARITQRKGK